MDFGTLPPEVNSARMYTGPGSGPMLAAAAAWDELSAELSWAASSYESVVSVLTGSAWAGPASMAMLASAAPHVTWLSSTALLAEQAANQARAAAAAFEAAFVMTVPPAEVAANRVLLATLIATNFFGQNTAAIAATEMSYADMWAQDVAAMYGYAGSSATASRLIPFTEPTSATRSGGLAAQAVAVAKAGAVSAGASERTVYSSELGLIPVPVMANALRHMSFASFSWPNPSDWWIVRLLGSITPDQRTAIVRLLGLSYFALGMTQFFASISQQLTFGVGTTAGSGGAWYATPLFAGLGGGQVGVTLASATKVGLLSVPPSWAASSAAAKPAAVATMGAHFTTASSKSTASLLHGIPASAGAGRRTTAFTHKYGFRHSVVARPPSAG